MGRFDLLKVVQMCIIEVLQEERLRVRWWAVGDDRKRGVCWDDRSNLLGLGPSRWRLFTRQLQGVVVSTQFVWCLD
jgi:hypothetical protein